MGAAQMGRVAVVLINMDRLKEIKADHNGFALDLLERLDRGEMKGTKYGVKLADIQSTRNVTMMVRTNFAIVTGSRKLFAVNRKAYDALMVFLGAWGIKVPTENEEAQPSI